MSLVIFAIAGVNPSQLRITKSVTRVHCIISNIVLEVLGYKSEVLVSLFKS